jgi:carbohydrate kinase (thermoresistant glucokinase family)
VLYLVMGVTGAGKTTVGRLLAERLHFPFYDADDFHPEANKAKMAANIPLDDADRWPWLERLASEATKWTAVGSAVLACSALKRAYRDVLFRNHPEHTVVFLKLDAERAKMRLTGRRGQHEFVKDYDKILAGQFRDLEEPEHAIVIPGELSPAEQVERAYQAITASTANPNKA